MVDIKDIFIGLGYEAAAEFDVHTTQSYSRRHIVQCVLIHNIPINNQTNQIQTTADAKIDAIKLRMGCSYSFT
jgi:hypothetical protein